MSTRDDDNEIGSQPSNRTGYRFPLRDRRFENTVVEGPEDDGSDEVFDSSTVDVLDDDADSGDTATDHDISSVRVRVRRRSPSASAASSAADAQGNTQGAVSPDDPVDDDPGIQEQDAPVARGRIAQAAARARNVQLNEKGRSKPYDSTTALKGRTSFNNSQRSTDQRTLEEFDAAFIEDARRMLGEGFVPANQLPGDLGDRVRHIVIVCNKYAKDFILDQLERMTVAHVPTDTIAARFRVTTPTIIEWRKKLKERWAKSVQELKQGDMHSIIGEHISRFEMRIAMGMTLAQKPNATLQEITRGLEIAERAQTNLIKYQDMLGFHSSQPLAVSDDTANADDKRVKQAKNLTNAISDLFGIASAFPVAGDSTGDSDLEGEEEYRVNE